MCTKLVKSTMELIQVGIRFELVYLWGIVVSVWATNGPRGGDGARLTVSIRRPESRLLQPARQRRQEHFSLTKSQAETGAAAALMQSTQTQRWTERKLLPSMLLPYISSSLNSRCRNKRRYYCCGRQRKLATERHKPSTVSLFLFTSC